MKREAEFEIPVSAVYGSGYGRNSWCMGNYSGCTTLFERKMELLEKDATAVNKQCDELDAEINNLHQAKTRLRRGLNQRWVENPAAVQLFFDEIMDDTAKFHGITVQELKENIADYDIVGTKLHIRNYSKYLEGEYCRAIMDHITAAHNMIHTMQKQHWIKRIREGHWFTVRALDLVGLISQHPAGKRTPNFTVRIENYRVCNFKLSPELLEEARKYERFYSFCRREKDVAICYLKAENKFVYAK